MIRVRLAAGTQGVSQLSETSRCLHCFHVYFSYRHHFGFAPHAILTADKDLFPGATGTRIDASFWYKFGWKWHRLVVCRSHIKNVVLVGITRAFHRNPWNEKKASVYGLGNDRSIFEYILIYQNRPTCIENISRPVQIMLERFLSELDP